MDKKTGKTAWLKIRAGTESREKFFKETWHRHGKKISFYINRLLFADEDYGEDIFQEVMMKVYTSLESYNPLYSFETWLFRIVRNHCIDILKKKKVQEVNSPLDETASVFPGPDEACIGKEIMEKIENTLESFTPGERELAFLRLYENLTFREISRITGSNINTLKTRMTQIQKRLRHALKDYHHE